MNEFLLIALFFSSSFGLPRHGISNGRIVGGEVTSIEFYPYQLSLEYFGFHDCGAAIVSETFAVTAAHCVSTMHAEFVKMRAGTSTRHEGGTLHPASEIIIHPNYDNKTIDVDIALIKVSTPFEFGSKVQPIPLVTEEPSAGEIATITGWGSTVYQGSYSPELQVVFLPIVDHEICNQDFMELYGGVTRFMICTSTVQGTKDACSGDSGGPLAVEGKLAGVISWGEECASKEYPGVYTNVALVRDFIVNITGVE